MKLWQKVNNLTGNSTASKNLVEYINMASKLLTSALPEKFLWSIATEDEVVGWDSSGTKKIGLGSDIAYDKILAVYRTDGADLNGVSKKRIAAEAPDKNIHIFDESESLLGATEMFPKFYKLSGKVYIKPDPDYNAQISDIPEGGTEQNNETYYKLGESTTTTVTPETGNKGIIVYAAPPVVDENTDSWLLAEFENVAIMYAGGMDMLYSSKGNRDNAGTSLTSATTSLTNYLSSFPSHGVSDIVVPNLDYSTIGVLETLVAEESGFTSDVFTMSGLSLPNPSDYIPSSSQSLDYTAIEDALTKSQNVVDNASSIGGDSVSSSAQSWLESEDMEMVDSSLKVSQQELTRARSNLDKEKTKLEEFQSSLGRGNQEFQAEIARWGAQVQKENARIDNELKQMRSDIEKRSFKSKEKKDKYASELQKVSTQLQIERETNNSKIQKFTNEVQKEVQSYGMDLKEKERFLQEAQQQMQKASAYLNVAAQNSQSGMQYYNWAMNELKAITGGVAAPQQQQQAQRAEERKSDQ
tara:strand:+ start:11231 stop:12808 length:1578 start_codon:yes stop_codon:yes gene_type:complete